MPEHRESCSIAKKGRGYRLECVARVSASIDSVFEFFADAGNLDLITPPYLRFRIQTPLPISMFKGTLIDYRLRLRGFPIRWQTVITAWEPPVRFVDEQRRGPYRVWIHEHRFRQVDGLTEIIDRVDYQVPGGRVAHALFVRWDLEGIFEYRRRRLISCFDR